MSGLFAFSCEKNSFFAEESLGFQIKLWHRKYNFDHCAVIIVVHKRIPELLTPTPNRSFCSHRFSSNLEFSKNQTACTWNLKTTNPRSNENRKLIIPFDELFNLRLKYLKTGSLVDLNLEIPLHTSIELISLKAKQCQTNRAHKSPAGFGVFWRRYKRMKINVESKFV